MPDRAYRNDLILLYAANRVSDIANVPAFRQLCSEFAQNPFFTGDRDQIELAKARVERTLDNPDMPLTQQQSVRNAIKLLVDNRRDKKRDLFHELIVAGYRKHWNAQQQQYFDAAWKMIQFDYDFFLSFTSRYPDPDVGGDNPINIAYKYFIKQVLGPDAFKGDDLKNTNLLARAVHKVLLDPPNRGFYFPRQQYDNDDTRLKLEKACDSSMLFVQIVQSIMFDPPRDRKNYCFFEWERVMARFPEVERDKRILYVLAGTNYDGLREIPLPDIYADWHSHITRKDVPYLPEAEFWDASTLKSIKKTILESLVAKIKNAWLELSIGAPN